MSATAIALGVSRVARFRDDGIDKFPASAQALLNSLAPLLALPIVVAGLLVLNGRARQVPVLMLMSGIALLGPVVLSHDLARYWGRGANWPRYAVAFNWCQWAIPVAAIGAMVCGALALSVGIPGNLIGMAMNLAVIVYAAVLHWFLAWRGLNLSRGRALLFVALVDIGGGLLWTAPTVIDTLIRGAE